MLLRGLNYVHLKIKFLNQVAWQENWSIGFFKFFLIILVPVKYDKSKDNVLTISFLNYQKRGHEPPLLLRLVNYSEYAIHVSSIKNTILLIYTHACIHVYVYIYYVYIVEDISVGKDFVFNSL